MSDKTLPTEDGKTAIRIGSDGKSLEYHGAAESGHIEIELPAPPGSPTAVERMLAKDFGPHVVGAIDRAMARQPYLKSGPQQSGPQTFKHYCAVARGAALMDAPALGRMEQLAKEFEAEPYQQEFFAMVVRPYLLNLQPKRR